MKRILVTGSREWKNREVIKHALLVHYTPGDIITHGDCRGADRLAGNIAYSFGWTVEAYPADWERHGRAAGPIRNREMLKLLSPPDDLALAFHEDLESSKGTRDMVDILCKKGIRTLLYDGKTWKPVERQLNIWN